MRVHAKAGRSHTRQTNRRLVLQQLIGGVWLSRADLARETGLTPATVSALVAELEADGLVTEVGTRRIDDQVGKPPTMLCVRPEARNIAAIDLGNPHAIRVALVDLNGAVGFNVELDCSDAVGDEALDLVEVAATAALENAVAPILGIGVGAPGVVADDGEVIENARFGWEHVRLADRLSSRLGVPAYVANDANVAAIAEYTQGDHDSDSLAVIKIGSGVGAGFLLDGVPYSGEHSAAGEIGHLVVDASGPLCRCGLYGCLETFLAAPNIEAACAESGADPEAIRRGAANRLGVAVAAMVSILGIDHISISGPPDLLGADFCRIARESVRNRCLRSTAASVQIEYSSLGDDIVILGAASLVLSQELGVA